MRTFILALTVGLLQSRCGPREISSDPREVDGHRLSAVAGAYNDGSGQWSLSLLATFRDASGQGPTASWTGALSDTRQSFPVSFEYPGAASYAAWWWSSVPLHTDTPHWLILKNGGDQASLEFEVPPGGGLDVPTLALADGGTRMDWPSVDGALSYTCRISTSEGLQRLQTSTTTGCDLSGLPAGAYVASMTASSADLDALEKSTAEEPNLPKRFDVSESRLAFSLGPSPFQFRAAGGAIQYGNSSRGLALFLSVTAEDGSPLSAAWDVQVVGPGLSDAAPLSFSYPASSPRQLVWAYDVQPQPGLYSATAHSALGTLTTHFSVGDWPALSIPSGVSASASGSGGAMVSWTAVPSAKSYYVSVWDAVAGDFLAGQWVAGTQAHFSPGTFASGKSCNAYVAATDADMLGSAVPTQVSVSEDSYSPQTFVAQ